VNLAPGADISTDIINIHIKKKKKKTIFTPTVNLKIEAFSLLWTIFRKQCIGYISPSFSHSIFPASPFPTPTEEGRHCVSMTQMKEE